MLKKYLSFKSAIAQRVSVSITATCLVFSIVAGVAAQEESADTTFVIVSGKNAGYWKPAEFQDGNNATVTVDENDKHQIFRGFAGTFNEAGWYALQVLKPDEQDSIINLLFNRKDGIGFQWGRIPIGASDYAKDRYSLDDGEEDLNMENFSIERDKNCLIKYIKAAQAVKWDIKFWASPWTPPPWMKTTSSGHNAGPYDNGGYDGGVMRNEPKVFDALALYFSKFISAYDSAGIPISAVCPQNEPGYIRSYPTCGWGPSNYDNASGASGNITTTEYLSTFTANHLYKKLQADHPETEIWFGTLSNNNSSQAYWNGMKGKDPNKSIVKGLGLQWNNYTMVNQNANAGYFVFCSEHQCGNYYWRDKVSSVEQADSAHFLPTMAPNNHNYGEESWHLYARWLGEGTHLYSAWNMILDTKGVNLNTHLEWPQNALIVVNTSAKTFQVTPYYYVTRHISQYVDSGAIRLGTSLNNDSLAMAFKNPNGAIVTILANHGSASKEMTVSANGKNIQFTHPGQGWATVYTGPPPEPPKEDPKTGNLNRNQISKKANGLKIATMKDGYRISLSSQAAGRIELLTPAGRLLASRAIAQGSKEVMLPKLATHTGLLIVRAVTGGEVQTAQMVAY